MYVLLDANVTAGYYLPRSLRGKRAAGRIENVFDSVRSGASNHFFYIPNFCVAEVFSVFMKHAYGHWNSHVRKKGTIDKRVYERLVWQFQADIHNGRFMYHYELSRYHVLGINLVAPIDHYFQFSRGKKNHAPMGTFDHLIISMGIHLAHIHGAENTVILSSDDRLCNILSKCRGGLPAGTIRRLKLNIAEEVTGKPFSPAIFPQCLNLKTATNADMATVFGSWPLPVAKLPAVYRWLRRPSASGGKPSVRQNRSQPIAP
jgi:hypothetical protein